jgi:ribonucleoside-diphosphate reductase alpha chain
MRYYTQEGLPPFEAVEWEFRTAAITSESGEVIFEQKNVEVPKSWSMTRPTSSPPSIFTETRGTRNGSRSVRQLIGRVARTIYGLGIRADTSRTSGAHRFS